jgi:hypothetical protein
LILPKAKKDDFTTAVLTTTPQKQASHFREQAGIYYVFRGLKFEFHAGIGQKGAFRKGLKSGAMKNSISHQGVMESFIGYRA